MSVVDLAVAVAVARALVAAGVPVFLARPAGGREWDPAGGTGGSGYWLPRGWERTEPDPSVLDRWVPGVGIGAVMGHVVAGLDVDPRNGGLGSLAGLPVPRVFGVQATPSGGWHGVIRTLGVRSRDKVRPGIDVKDGRPDGSGRGFLWIAPTIKMSKVTGEVTAYRWTRTPDLTGIEDDTSGAELAEVIRALRAPAVPGAGVGAPAIPTTAPRLLVGLVDLVLSAPEGERNSRLHWAACRAVEHDRAGRLDWQQAAAALSAAAAEVALSNREITATLHSAYYSTKGTSSS